MKSDLKKKAGGVTSPRIPSLFKHYCVSSIQGRLQVDFRGWEGNFKMF